MNNISRRNLLRGAAGGVAAVTVNKTAHAIRSAHASSEAAKMAQIGNHFSGNLPVDEELGTRFTSFKSWLDTCGERLMERAAEMNGSDPDIIEMHISLQAKRRMQINRNYKRLVAQKKKTFAERFKIDGWVGEWL